MDNSSPRSSSRTSIAHSAYSAAGSTRHILGHMNNTSNDYLNPPNAPFRSVSGSSGGTSSLNSSTSLLIRPGHIDTNSAPLSVNYLPTKFSAALISPSTFSTRKRKNRGIDPKVPKRGGGVEAFRSGEARMPGQGDDDYDGVNSGIFGGGKGKKLRWNGFKWTLFIANLLLTSYSLVALIFCLLTWFNVWTHADIVRVGNRDELIVSTIASICGLLTSIIGWAGILLNNRGFLAVYTFLLWITFGFMVVPGYLTYKQRTFNLEGKINSQWSRNLGAEGRLRIQNQLNCCGYFSPFVEATVSQSCYARSVLPGCKLSYMDFERMVLERWYIVAFGLVPVHLFVIISALLCSNHVTWRFGKGMMPEAYRLNMNSMAVIMDNYANQLADQYGEEVASDIIKKSRSNLQLDVIPSTVHASGAQPIAR
ncbi:tetraspanin Tsp2 family [Crucibulum laeve]|uniref:Tetraspanin Tsp2 family n=1 Tax=Crucibulum laeve TaxID=68775 RepID=A0A5C3LT95_9AGAR|nr:tetraspanin Tsp2 family [Crucibulum laeve]